MCIQWCTILSLLVIQSTSLDNRLQYLIKIASIIILKLIISRARSSVPGLGGLTETKMFLPHPRVKLSIVGSLRVREVACLASDRQGSNFKSCVWRTVSSHSPRHPQEVPPAQFSLYVHKGGLKPDSFSFLLYYSHNTFTYSTHRHTCGWCDMYLPAVDLSLPHLEAHHTHWIPDVDRAHNHQDSHTHTLRQCYYRCVSIRLIPASIHLYLRGEV